jgi:trimethylamine--corrinoid protein Co-methyltransferase
MLDFESCQSLEKLVVDDEICGMALRLARGITPREDFPSLPLFRELLEEGHLLISAHTRRHLRAEHHVPGRVLDRAQRSRWLEEGGRTLGERASAEVERILAAQPPSRIGEGTRRALEDLMAAEARRHGVDHLPVREDLAERSARS